MKAVTRLFVGVVAALLAISLPMLGETTAWADHCKSEGTAGDESFMMDLTCESHGGTLGGLGDTVRNTASVEEPSRTWRHRWAANCRREGSATDPDAGDACGLARACLDGRGILATHWALELRLTAGEYLPVGSWVKLGQECITFDPDNPPADAARPRVTWQLVLREIERVGLPALRVQVQPEQRTLVNFETIFYAEPRPFERELRLLGQRVQVRATPTAFHWRFGDGSRLQTQSAGAPYPSKEIVHEYVDADVTLRPSVDVTYSAEFRVNGGGWQEIPESITIEGPAEELRVLEATAVLVGSGG